MTRKAFFVALAATLSFSVAFSQKNNVKSAERIAKDKNANFDEARQLINGAMQNPETMNDPKTFYIAGFIEETNFTTENLKQVVGEEPNREVMNKALLDMYGYYMKAREMDNTPNEKGKIKPRYTKDILKAFENNLLYFINAGGYYFEKKNFDKALEAFNDFRSIKALPEFAGGPIAAADSNSMTVDFYSVVTAYQANKKEQAVELAKKIQDVPYRQNDLLQILAQTQQELGDKEGYAATMDKGMKLFPDEPYYSVNLINSYIEQGKDEEAIAILNKAIENSPNNAQLYDVMGKLHENAGRIEEAIKSLEKALAVDPNFTEANYDLGRIYYNQGVTLKSGDKVDATSEAKAKEYFQKALPYLEKAYEVNPDGSYYVLGNVYYQLGMEKDYEKVMSAHKKAE